MTLNKHEEAVGVGEFFSDDPKFIIILIKKLIKVTHSFKQQ